MYLRGLLASEALLSLALTPYGSFVARALLQEPRVDAAAGLARLRRGRGDLEATKHGRRGRNA